MAETARCQNFDVGMYIAIARIMPTRIERQFIDAASAKEDYYLGARFMPSFSFLHIPCQAPPETPVLAWRPNWPGWHALC